MQEIFLDFIKQHHKICIIQAENPDGDSLGSSGALEEILADHSISLYCPVQIPRYLHYLPVASRVSMNFDYSADAYIIVDTASEILLSKILKDPAAKHALETKPVLVIDHHASSPDLHFDFTPVITQAPSTTTIIYQLTKTLSINKEAATYIYAGLASDTLGLTSESTTKAEYLLTADLIDKGLDIPALEKSRHEYMKKSARILDYKADLIKRVEYHLDGRLATVHISWDDIKEYSDEYNPNVLILEELRLVEGVDVAVAIKTYPDGKLTGKIRTTLPIAEQISGFFGGGGHLYASGFRVYEKYDIFMPELIKLVDDLLSQNKQDDSDIKHRQTF